MCTKKVSGVICVRTKLTTAKKKMPSEFKFKVPRLYKAATKIVKSVKEEGSDSAELVKQCKKKTNVKALSALIQKVLDNEKVLDHVIESTGILKDQKGADPWLYRVLITELLLGKKRLPVGCKPIQTVLAFGPKLNIELRKLKMRERTENDTEESSSEASDDEALSEKEEEPPEKKAKQQRNNKKKVSKEQPKSPEDQSGMSEDQTGPEMIQDSDGEEAKSAAKKSEDYISIKPSDIQAKRRRNFGMHPKSKKFMSPKQRNLQKVKQFAKRAHSLTPRGKQFGKDKPRYFEVPSSV